MTDIDIDDGQESAPTFHSYDYFTNLLSTDENVTGTSSQRQLSDSMICEVGECGEPFWWMEPLLELTLNEQQPISGLCSSCCKKTTTAIGQTNYSQKGEVKQDVQPFTEQRKLHEALPSVSFLNRDKSFEGFFASYGINYPDLDDYLFTTSHTNRFLPAYHSNLGELFGRSPQRTFRPQSIPDLTLNNRNV